MYKKLKGLFVSSKNGTNVFIDIFEDLEGFYSLTYLAALSIFKQE